MVVIDDYGCGSWTGFTFKNLKELKDFLQEEACNNSEYSDDEYYNLNVDVDLDQYCEIFQMKYVIKEEEE